VNQNIKNQFAGENKGECVKEAKLVGWKFKKDGKVICPCCVKLKEDKIAEYIKEWSKI
jgi:hypothetical protein